MIKIFNSTAGYFIVAVAILGLGFMTPSALGAPVLGFTQNAATVRCVNKLPEVTLSWTPEADTRYYRIQRRNVLNAPWSGFLDSQIRSNTYTDIRFKSDYGARLYFYRIEAVKNSGNVFSNAISIAVPECRTTSGSVVVSTPVPTPTPTPVQASTSSQLATTTSPISTKFVKGDKIAVKKERPELNVRVSPSISAQVVGTQPALALGTIVGGPIYDSVNKYWFWNIDYISNADGWSVEYWIEKIGSTASTSAPSPVPATATSSATKIPEGMKWGVYAGWSNLAMAEFEALTHKQPDMEMVFVHWGNETQFPFYYGSRIRDKGRTMVLFWEASDFKRDPFSQPEYSFDAVLSGKLDSYFATFAAGAKAYGGPVILIPYSEMNGNWNGWGGTIGNNTPAKLIAAYRYIHTFFADVPNVKFGWAPNSNSVPNTIANRMETYYPGDDVVDYVGVDGFNFSGTLTFDQIFGDVLSRLKQYKKPIYIFSMASAANQNKALWITDALTIQLYKYPEIAGWLWFNQNKERDWRVSSDPNSLDAFVNALP